MKLRLSSCLMLPIVLVLTGCTSGGGGDGGFGNGATGIAYVVNTGPNEISAYTTDVVGALRGAGTVALAKVPSSMAVTSNLTFAFVGTNDGIFAFRVNPVTAELASVSGSPFSTGMNIRAVEVSRNSQFLYAANNNGTVAAYSIHATTGVLTLIENETVGTSPSGVALSATGQFLFVSNQGSNNITAFRVDGTTGALTFEENESAGTSPSGVVATASGTGGFLFASNQGSNTVSAYTIDGTTGALTFVETENVGTSPSGVAVSPNGQFLYVSNQGSNDVSGLTINATTGALTAIGSSTFSAGASPSGLTIEPDGQFVYIANSGGGGDVSGFRITAGTGALVSLGATFPAGTTPVGIATPGYP